MSYLTLQILDGQLLNEILQHKGFLSCVMNKLRIMSSIDIQKYNEFKFDYAFSHHITILIDLNSPEIG